MERKQKQGLGCPMMIVNLTEENNGQSAAKPEMEGSTTISTKRVPSSDGKWCLP